MEKLSAKSVALKLEKVLNRRKKKSFSRDEFASVSGRKRLKNKILLEIIIALDSRNIGVVQSDFKQRGSEHFAQRITVRRGQ